MSSARTLQNWSCFQALFFGRHSRHAAGLCAGALGENLSRGSLQLGRGAIAAAHFFMWNLARRGSV
jgi:hypothetical protein